MQYVGQIHARVPENLTIAQRHSRLTEYLNSLSGPWKLRSELPSMEGVRYDVALVKSFAKNMPAGLSLQVIYQRRRPELWMEDNFLHDDVLNVKLSGKLARDEFFNGIFPALNDAFEAYYGHLSSLDSIEVLKKRVVVSHSSNTRDCVPTIEACSYWDEQLCSRSFNLLPEVLGSRLSDHAPTVLSSRKRVYFSVSSNELSATEEYQRCEAILRAIRQ